ncbi:TIP41-like family-domain-containing protein [Baffinella frigidus]|nr:TIP41-like family-domain-containing protein [Cryptophyta sp. CCMP2293]
MQAPWATGATARPQVTVGSSGLPDAAATPPTNFEQAGWTFCARKGPILSTADADRWTKELGMTLPEMVFGETDLVVANAAAGVELSFKAYDSLAACGDSSDIKVSMSKKWMEANSEVPDAQQYDWTYSTLFKGTVTKSGEPLVPQLTSSRKIDLESLKPGPGREILWSADLMLWEDELHDNGSSYQQVRIRVTCSYFYILVRLFVRVDGVKIRMRESRIHHRFGDAHSLRQHTVKEAEYAGVQASCTPKQLSEGILDDPDQLSAKLRVVQDGTEILTFVEGKPQEERGGGVGFQEQVWEP